MATKHLFDKNFFHDFYKNQTQHYQEKYNPPNHPNQNENILHGLTSTSKKQ